MTTYFTCGGFSICLEGWVQLCNLEISPERKVQSLNLSFEVDRDQKMQRMRSTQRFDRPTTALLYQGYVIGI